MFRVMDGANRNIRIEGLCTLLYDANSFLPYCVSVSSLTPRVGTEGIMKISSLNRNIISSLALLRCDCAVHLICNFRQTPTQDEVSIRSTSLYSRASVVLTAVEARF